MSGALKTAKTVKRVKTRQEEQVKANEGRVHNKIKDRVRGERKGGKSKETGVERTREVEKTGNTCGHNREEEERQMRRNAQ